MPFKAIHNSKIQSEKVIEGGAENTEVQWLITKDDGAENFAMRLFTMTPGGRSPLHSHNWEHEVFILEGQCKVICEDETVEVGPGYTVFIPPKATHNFRNEGTTPLKFLCLVPHHK
jgi:quercetin dioxygenase-like cupin family protein